MVTEEITKDSVQLARLEERMANLSEQHVGLTEQIGDIQRAVSDLAETVGQAKAGWKVFLALGGLVGTAIEGIHQLASHFIFKP